MRKISIIFLLFFIIFIIIFLFKKDIIKKNNKIDFNSECITAKIIKTVKNTSMEPLIMPDEELELLEGYYDCNEIIRGDIIAYSSAGADYPIIKKILVLGGDSLEFKNNRLLVNNNILKNSANEEYVFEENEKKMISLYIKEGKLKENTYLIFGDNIYGSLDSKNFGAISKNGIIGKFIIDK